MNKSVLISIRPEWCELIASGKKTIEVRKTRPKIEPPFKVYIYCSQTSHWNPALVYQYENPNGNIYIGGKNYSEFMSARVVGEFICDDITRDVSGEYALEFETYGCMPFEQQKEYAPKQFLYGWHISDLKMYDKPKELGDFGVNRPPQNWMYVEPLGGDA